MQVGDALNLCHNIKRQGLLYVYHAITTSLSVVAAQKLGHHIFPVDQLLN